jgi:predicted phosphodiesterase
MIARRQFLRWSTAALPFIGRASETPSGPATSFFVVSDTHYFANEESHGELDVRSVERMQRLIDWLNRLPGSPIPSEAGGGQVPEPAGVIHAGDIIDSGDKNGAKYERMQQTELEAFGRDFGIEGNDGRLRWPVREVHGNHDSPQGKGQAIDLLIERNRKRKHLAGLSENGLHSAWEWGGVHFFNLGIVVGEVTTPARRRRYAPMGSLDFLKAQLAAVPADRPIVITHHIDMMRYAAEVEEAKVLHHEWDFADVRAYWDAIRERKIALVLYGHTHARNVFRWNGGNRPAPDGERAVPAFNADNSGHFKDRKQTLNLVTVDAAGTLIREFATADAWETGAWTPQLWRFPA